jgi:hypothetical protein
VPKIRYEHQFPRLPGSCRTRCLGLLVGNIFYYLNNDRNRCPGMSFDFFGLMTDVTHNINYTEAHEHPKKRRRKWIIIGSIILFLLVVRLVMPYFVLKYVNKTLAKSKTYPGHVRDIDLAIIRGAYVIKDIRLDKRDTVTGNVDSILFFTSRALDLSVEWRALFKGKIVGEISVEEPRLNFVKGKHKNENVKQDTSDFQDILRNLMPLTINRFEVNNGRIHYLDKYSKPSLNISLKNIHVIATNLTNVNDSAKVLPAGMKASAEAYDGVFDLNVKFDAMQKQPTFDLNARITNVNMVKLNDFFRAYGNFDVNKGTFGLYTEFAAKNGKFTGYVKPLIKDLDVVAWNKEEGDLGQKLWESVVGTVGEIFKNQPKDQLATKVPINGSFNKAQVNLWDAISYVLRNAFVNALRPSVDNTIDLSQVGKEEKKETLLQKVFGKNEKDDKGKEATDDKKTRKEKRAEKREEKKEKRDKEKEDR